MLSLIIFLLDWFMIRWKYKLDMNHTMTVGDIVNSIISVDRGEWLCRRPRCPGEDRTPPVWYRVTPPPVAVSPVLCFMVRCT